MPRRVAYLLEEVLAELACRSMNHPVYRHRRDPPPHDDLPDDAVAEDWAPDGPVGEGDQ